MKKYERIRRLKLEIKWINKTRDKYKDSLTKKGVKNFKKGIEIRELEIKQLQSK